MRLRPEDEHVMGSMARRFAMKRTWIVVVWAVALAAAGLAADSFPEVEYLSGKAGFAKKAKGQLTVDEKAVSFADQKGKPLFSIPMAEIDKSDSGTQREEGSFGRKMALGIFASHTDEFLTIQTHNTAGAEGLVFKVKKKTGAGMAAKINFWSGKAKAAAAEPPPDAPPQKPAEPPPND
jgi:opacity protein-like surface antigen